MVQGWNEANQPCSAMQISRTAEGGGSPLCSKSDGGRARAGGMVAARTRPLASRSRSDLFADEEKRKGRREDDGRRGHKQPTEEQWR